MSYQEKANLINRLKQALENFEKNATPEQIAAVHKTLQQHSDALFKSGDVKNIKTSEFSLIKSLLEDKLEDDTSELKSRLAGLVDDLDEEEKKTLGMGELEFYLKVLPDGEIFGDGKYEVLDIGWAEAFIVWLDYYFTSRDFPQPGVWLQIPDKTNFAIFGDWGGGCWDGNTVAETISRLIKNLEPDYSVHLGDVYYTGEPTNEQPYLLDLWPAGQKDNFTLNSNHEMYPVGNGYFDVALANNLFKSQQGKSFFALENSNWIIVGLDSAFASDKNDLYLQGAINSVQQDFLKAVAAKGKSVIVMCHHNPVDLTATNKETLWGQVHDVLGDSLKYWYWGHAHGGAVYNDIENVKCRLVGHGVIPWGNSSSLKNSVGKSVVWYENNSPSPQDKPRVQNGFALLTLDGLTVKESFYGEDGLVHWSS